MAIPMLPDAGLGLFKSETTYGTDAVPTAAANAVAIGTNIRISPDPNILARDYLRDTLSALKDVVAGALINFSFEFEVKGAGGAVDVVPRYGPILKAFGFGQTVNAASNVTYAFVNSGFSSLTAYLYMGEILHKVTGVFGRRLTIREEARNYARFTADMSGLYVAPVDAAIAAGAVFDPSVPVQVQSLALTLGGYTPIAHSLEINLDTGIDLRTDFNSSDGIKGFSLGRRNITGRIDPEAVQEATHPFWANFKAGTSVALAGNTIGSAVGNRVQITGAAVQYDGPNWEVRGRVRTYGLGVRFRASTDTASDELTIVTT